MTSGQRMDRGPRGDAGELPRGAPARAEGPEPEVRLYEPKDADEVIEV
jgi:hypothetical protein